MGGMVQVGPSPRGCPGMVPEAGRPRGKHPAHIHPTVLQRQIETSSPPLDGVWRILCPLGYPPGQGGDSRGWGILNRASPSRPSPFFPIFLSAGAWVRLIPGSRSLGSTVLAFPGNISPIAPAVGSSVVGAGVGWWPAVRFARTIHPRLAIAFVYGFPGGFPQDGG